MITARADVVGSLLRPPWLLQAHKEFAAGNIDQSSLRSIEDKAVDEAVLLQQDAGLGIVTDGEMRRQSFQSQMTEAVEGFGEHTMDAFLWGSWHGDKEVGDWSLDRPPTLGVVKKLTRKRYLSVHEFTYLKEQTTRIPKITLPSPSLFANFWSPERSKDVYPTLDHLLADIADILKSEVLELVRLGATYIQLDAPHYCLLLDPKTKAFYESRGWSAERWLQAGIELDNEVMGRHPEVTFGFHL